jgi:uncharacterized protein (DUF58 family)
VTGLRQALVTRLTRWAARRHGTDRLPVSIDRRRIYIVPTRFGLSLALLLIAMLLAGLNYNSNLGLAFGFLLTSLALVAMHHCHRNLLGLGVDVSGDVDAFAGGFARFDFVLQNDSAVERRDIEIRCGEDASSTECVTANDYRRASVEMEVASRGVVRQNQFELRSRYPFGWFRAWTYVHSPLRAFVAPQPRGNRGLPASAHAGAAAHSLLRGDDDFAGLRTYEPGIPLKHMAWKVLARGGEPAVRSYSSLAGEPEWLDWSILAGLDDETRLSQLCRWVLESDATHNLYGLRIPGAEIAPGHGAQHKSECLRTLARYGTVLDT